MVGLIAFGRPDNLVMAVKTYSNQYKPTYQASGTVTIPGTKTKSIGLHRLPSAAKGLPTAQRVAASGAYAKAGVFAPDSYRELSEYRDAFLPARTPLFRQ